MENCKEKKHVNVQKILTNAEIFNVAVWSMKSFDSRITNALINGTITDKIRVLTG